MEFLKKQPLMNKCGSSCVKLYLNMVCTAKHGVFICDLINADEYMFRRSVYCPGKPHPLRPQRACEGELYGCTRKISRPVETGYSCGMRRRLCG